MYRSLDHFIITIFLLVQWRLTVLLLGAVERRFRGATLGGAQRLIFGFNALLAVTYLCTLSEVTSALQLPPQFSAIVGALWMMYFGGSAMFVVLHAVLQPLRRKVADDVNPVRRQLLNTVGTAAMAAPFVVIGYGSLVERSRFHVRELDLAIPGLPDDLNGIRILQLSDIHLSAFLSEAELARVIDASIELRPHLAVVTGDLISAYGDPLDDCIRQLSRLRTDAGVYGCLGNHERYAKAEDYTTAAAARASIRFLRHESAQVRFGKSVINLAGVDYQPKIEKANYLHGAEKLMAPGAMNILLSHSPDVFPVAAGQGYDLMLAGHTHGGQVAVEILDQDINPARFITPFVYGKYRQGKATAYVTSGIGTIGIPTRIGVPPEIPVLRLRKA